MTRYYSTILACTGVKEKLSMIKPACKKTIYDNIIDDGGEGQKRKPIPHLADDDGILVDFGCMFF